MRIIAALSLATACLGSIVACASSPRAAGPRLIAVAGPNGDYCRRAADGRLGVTIRNEGGAPSSALLRAEIDFAPGGIATEALGTVAPGGSAELWFPIPPACFDSDCNFTIRVADGVQGSPTRRILAEASGLCVG